MIIDKYTWWRRAIFAMQRAVPFTRRIKNVAPKFKFKKYRRRMDAKREEIRASLESTGRYPLFKRIEIETFNRCNGECSFCPVNKKVDTRKPTRMETSLFESIIAQLARLDYRGMVCLYSNNEPFLDDRMVDFVELTARSLPNANILLSTNGLLLDAAKYRAVIDNLGELVIDNYCDDFTFRPNVREIIDISSANPEWDKKTRVTMRYVNEVMTSRGGLSPNKKDIANQTLPFGCMSPTQQLIVRPDGKLSLCCNDALGTVTMGDLSVDSIEDVWFGERYTGIKRQVMESRDVFPICKHCDTMNS